MNNIISFNEYIGNLDEIMKEVGYTKRYRQGDYILNSGHSRFHAHVCSVKKKAIKIHYDTTVGHRHVVFRMPLTIEAEKRRMYDAIRYRHKDNPVRVILTRA